jgi:dihydropteroate synthase
VLNVTPDSFSDGGQHAEPEAALAAGATLVAQGADWIDVGGESTRPEAAPVAEEEERRRVVPVLQTLRARLPAHVRLSIDTYKAGTAAAALAAGATVVNDVSGGALDPDVLSVAARADAAIVLGHLRGIPRSMMEGVGFGDVVEEVAAELGTRIAAARAAGCREIWIDPGIGFGKLLDHNLALLAHLPDLRRLAEVQIMIGVSRKRFIGELTGKPVDARVFGTAGAVAAAVMGGADALRVHDVEQMRDVIAVAAAIAGARRRL